MKTSWKEKISTWSLAICFITALPSGAALLIEILAKHFPWILEPFGNICGPDGCLGGNIDYYATIYLLCSAILIFRYHYKYGMDGEKIK